MNLQRKLINRQLFLEDVDLVMQPVKHTYAQNNYECSPPKDDFDQLLGDSAKALTPASQTQEDDVLKSAELSTGKRRGRRSQNQCRFPQIAERYCFTHFLTLFVAPSRPVRRSTRLQSLSGKRILLNL